MRILVAALALLLAAPATVAAQADAQLREAIRRYTNLEIDQSRSLFERVISPSSPYPVTEPQRVVAYKYLGAITATLGEDSAAVTYFVSAIGRDPLVDLDPTSFSEQERRVFNAARQRVFRVGIRPIPRDTVDPQHEHRLTLTVATTHLGSLRAEMASTETDLRFVLFDGTVEGPRDIPFTGLLPGAGGFVPSGIYELFISGQSRVITSVQDSTSALIEIQQLVDPLEDTIATFTAAQLLPERYPGSVATRSLLFGVGAAAAAFLTSRVIVPGTLEAPGIMATTAAMGTLGAGFYGWTYRRRHPEIPPNVTENVRRQRERSDLNRDILQRNAARIAATKLVVRPLGQ